MRAASGLRRRHDEKETLIRETKLEAVASFLGMFGG